MTGYRVLCGVVGVLFALLGLSLFVGFFGYHAGDAAGLAPFRVGPHGAYLAAFTGSAMAAWGFALLAAARRPAGARGLGTATAFGLVLLGLYRIVAWIVGDYAAFGDLLRVEAGVFLLLALAFVWMRPPHPEVA